MNELERCLDLLDKIVNRIDSINCDIKEKEVDLKLELYRLKLDGLDEEEFLGEYHSRMGHDPDRPYQSDRDKETDELMEYYSYILIDNPKERWA